MSFGSRTARLTGLCLVLVLTWAMESGAHRRGGLPLARPTPPAAERLSDKEKPHPSSNLDPEVYWQKLLAHEQAGDLPAVWKTALALVNLFPRAPQRGPALLKLAELLHRENKTAEAVELYDLAATLTADPVEAAKARLAARVVAFTCTLPAADPLKALKRFIQEVSIVKGASQAANVREALETGWQAVFAQAQKSSPVPLQVLEEILALWEAQPQELRPPGAARQLVHLLREGGLGEAAQGLEGQVGNKTSEKSPNLLGGGLGDTSHLNGRRQEGEPLYPPLRPWAVFWPMSAAGPSWGEPKVPFLESFLDWFLPQKAQAAWPAGHVRPAGPFLAGPPLSPVVSRLTAQLAHCSLTARYPGGVHWESPGLIDKLPTPELEPFYQDLMGVNLLRSGQEDAAAATFHELSQHRDPFWQRVARVRLADLELSRLQAKPSP